jgi:hypothetical protein
MAALRQRRRSVFEDVGVALGLMDDADEADEFVAASSEVAVAVDGARDAGNSGGLLQIIAEALGLADAPPVAVAVVAGEGAEPTADAADATATATAAAEAPGAGFGDSAGLQVGGSATGAVAMAGASPPGTAY